MKKAIATAVVCMLFVACTKADPVVLTFEGLQNFEAINNYYNGGYGSLGTGPGPEYGITFSQYALAYIHGQQSGHISPFPGDPSPPTVLLDFNTSSPYGAGYPTSITMDVSTGFTRALSFYYLAIEREASVTIYSGLDGTGTILAQESLPTTGEVFSNQTIVNFTGVADSVVFTGGNDQLALDNISFASPIPEPAGWISLTIGLVAAYLVFSRLRRIAAARSGLCSRVA